MIWLAAAAMAAPPSTGEIWTEIGVEARVSDPWSIGLTQNVRSGTSPLRVNEILTDIGAEVRFTDTWRASAAYRFGSKYDEGARPFAHRYTIDGRGRWSVEWLDLELRERWQVRLPVSDNDMRHTLRTRLRAGLDLDGRVEPRFAVEPFVGLGDGNGTGDGIGLTKVRFDVGTKIELHDNADLDVTYRLEEPVRDRTDYRVHVISVGLGFGIDLRKDDDDYY